MVFLACTVGAALLAISSTTLLTTKPSVSPQSGAPTQTKVPSSLNDLFALTRAQIETCDVALLNLLCTQGLRGAENLNVGVGLATLDQWARHVDLATRRHLYRYQRNPREFDGSEAKFRMLMLGVVLQTNLRIYKKWPIPVTEEEIAAFDLLKSMPPPEELAAFLSIRGACLMSEDRAEEAVACQEQALRLDPDDQAHRLVLDAMRREIVERSRRKSAVPGPEEFLPDSIGNRRPPWEVTPSFPGISVAPTIPNPKNFLPRTPQGRIPNPYPQGGP